MHSHNGRIRPGGSVLVLVLLLSLFAATQSFGDGASVNPPVTITGMSSDTTTVPDSLAGPESITQPEEISLWWLAILLLSTTL